MRNSDDFFLAHARVSRQLFLAAVVLRDVPPHDTTRRFTGLHALLFFPQRISCKAVPSSRVSQIDTSAYYRERQIRGIEMGSGFFFFFFEREGGCIPTFFGTCEYLLFFVCPALPGVMSLSASLIEDTSNAIHCDSWHPRCPWLRLLRDSTIEVSLSSDWRLLQPFTRPCCRFLKEQTCMPRRDVSDRCQVWLFVFWWSRVLMIAFSQRVSERAIKAAVQSFLGSIDASQSP